MKFQNIIKRLAANLKSTYETSLFEHSGNKGTEREQVLIDFLRKVMPPRYGFKSGEVFDRENNGAGQIDIIIYDALHSLVFKEGKDMVCPIESTYGIISVKSKMGTKELEDAIGGIEKYEKLKRPQAKLGQYFIDPHTDIQSGRNISISGSYQKNINCIFAFDTVVAHKTIVDRMKDADCVDLLIVPDRLIVFGRSRGVDQLIVNGKPIIYCLHETKNSVVIFVLVLLEYFKHNKLIARSNLKLLTELFKEQF